MENKPDTTDLTGTTQAGHDHDDGHDHAEDEHTHDEAGSETGSPWREYLPAILSFVLLVTGIGLQYYGAGFFESQWVRLVWFGVAYVIIGWKVVWAALKGFARLDFFNEFSLMGIATIGAFVLGEYAEGVAVMLFYGVGELFQTAAVNRAKRSIKALLDVRPDKATVWRDGAWVEANPETVAIGETIQIKPGGKVPLDGRMLSEDSSFDTAALTGESKPNTIRQGETVLAGMLNLSKLTEVKVTKKFGESSLAKILDLVQNAAGKKAPTQQFISRFAKIYTPIVFFLAVALAFLPYFFVADYNFSIWVYRALVFLVIACPCALVISIPLGYFGGIGAASRNGILFKGSNYLDLMTQLTTVVMDKTGTLTQGVFEVQQVQTEGYPETELIGLLAALESKSSHPVAKAVTGYATRNGLAFDERTVENVEEIAGHGLKGRIDGKTVLAGNLKLLARFSVNYPPALNDIVDTVVVAAIDSKYAGHLTIADQIKPDAREAIIQLRKNGIRETVMLSGDKNAVTQKVAVELGMDSAFGDLLPEGKVQKLEELKRDPRRKIAFVGDGINDAPVLALSDVGMAMGGMGSDVAIETADVIIQTDQPSKIATAIQIGRATRRIVWQNISLAFGVKVIVLILGAGGLATMWEAVFADVGVALLAILNAVRIQSMKFWKSAEHPVNENVYAVVGQRNRKTVP